MNLISSKQIAGVELLCYIRKVAMVAVGDDGVALALEPRKVVDDLRAEERRAALQRGLVDDDPRTFSLDTLHDTLYRRLAEVIRPRLHRKAVDAHCDYPLTAGIPHA